MHIIQKLKNITDRRLALESAIMGIALGTMVSIGFYSFLKPPKIQVQVQPQKQPVLPADYKLIKIEEEIAAIQKKGTKSRKVFDWINDQRLKRIAIYKTDDNVYLAVPPEELFKPSATLIACYFNSNSPVIFSAPITYDGNQYKIGKGTYKFGQLGMRCPYIMRDELLVFYEKITTMSSKYIEVPSSLNFR